MKIPSVCVYQQYQSQHPLTVADSDKKNNSEFSKFNQKPPHTSIALLLYMREYYCRGAMKIDLKIEQPITPAMKANDINYLKEYRRPLYVGGSRLPQYS